MVMIKNGVGLVLRLEGFMVLLCGVFLYSQLQQPWLHFLYLFFIPDLTFLAYLAGAKVGAIAYNAAHSYALALVPVIIGFAIDKPLLLAVGVTWCAHIGFDRMLGYGLKYAKGFNHTHLGTIGKEKRR